MKRTWAVLAATLLVAVALLWSVPAGAATDGVYTLAETTAAWDGTSANRLQATTNDYKYAYGDEASVTYTLPWAFTFYGQSYTQINADTNGNIWFTASGSAHSFDLASTGRGPVIAAWNNDLSSRYYGGVFVQHKTNPERVVVQWQAETYTDEGEHRVSNVEAVLYPYGAVRLDYQGFDTSDSNDYGSGISKGDGSQSLSLTTTVAPVTGLAGHSYLYTANAISVAVAANPTAPQTSNTPITFTATGSGGSGSYEYRFYLNSGSGFVLQRDYSASNSWTWTPSAAGFYDVFVEIRQAGTTVFRDAYTSLLAYQITSPATGVTVTPNPAAPQAAGTPITFTAAGQGGSGSYEYRFYLNSGSGYVLQRDYSTTSTWIWTPSAAGFYDVFVEVRNAGSTVLRDAYTSLLAYQVTNPPASGVTVTPNLAAPQATGTPITFTAAGQGGSGSYEYRFYLNSGSGYVLQQDYSTASTWTWTPSTAGFYDVFVEVRNAGTVVFRDAYTSLLAYQITGP